MSTSRSQVISSGRAEGGAPWTDFSAARRTATLPAGPQMPSNSSALLEGTDDLPESLAGATDPSNGVGNGSLDAGYSRKSGELDERGEMADSGGFAGRPGGWER